MFGICIIAGVVLSVLNVFGATDMPWWSETEISVLMFPLLSFINLIILLMAAVLDVTATYVGKLFGMRL